MQDAEAQAAARKVDEPAPQKAPVGFLSSNKDSWLQLFLNKYLFSVVYSLPGKAVIISIVIAGIVLGAVGIVRPLPTLKYLYFVSSLVCQPSAPLAHPCRLATRAVLCCASRPAETRAAVAPFWVRF